MNTENLESNFSRILRINTLISDNLQQENVVIENRRINNLFNPINDYDSATKSYVDTFPDISIPNGPENSIQLSSGSNFLGIEALIYENDTLKIQDTLTVNDISITNSTIENVNDITNDTDAINNEYITFQDLQRTSISVNTSSNNLTPVNIYNKYIIRENFGTGFYQDILPSYDSVKTFIDNKATSFKFLYFFKGTSHSIILFGNIIPNGNFDNFNKPISCITIPKNTIVYFTVYLDTTNEIIYYMIKNVQSLYISPIVNDIGITTDSFVSENSVNNNNLIIYNLLPTSITLDAQYTYTYSDLRKKLIIRSGLTANRTDTLDVLANFTNNDIYTLGTGQFKFVIQNISDFNLTVGPGSPPTGWLYSPSVSRIIPAGSNGIFYVNYNGTNLILQCIGIVSRDG